MTDEFEYTPYKYEDPRDAGAERKTTRTWLRTVHHYRLPYSYVDDDGKTCPMVKLEEHRHPNILYKILSTVLFPASVIMLGAPEAWDDWKRHMWDRRYGAFIACGWFRGQGE